MAKELTKKDMADLQAYQAAIRELSSREPPRLTGEEWDEAMAAIWATGEIPEKYRGRIGENVVTVHDDIIDGKYTHIPEGVQKNTLYDIVWERWSAEARAVNQRYNDVIVKALSVAMAKELTAEGPTKISDIIDKLLTDPVPTSQLLLQRYLPMLNGYPTNDLAAVGPQGLELDSFTRQATYTRDGRTLTIQNVSQLTGAVGTSAKKIMDTATAYLTATNYYRAENPIPTATIDLMDYWRAQGLPVDPQPMDTEKAQRAEQERVEVYIKYLKAGVKADLEKLEGLEWRGQGTGRNRSDYEKLHFVSGHRMRGTTLTVNFDIDIARYLIQAYEMQWPTALLLHDNRDFNGYAIGRKLALHHSMDSNAAAGTDCTISVKSLLEEAPDITTIEKLRAKGRRDWKKQIKEKLEQALNKNISPAPLLKRWEYRSPSTGARYTPDTASALTWDEYITLMVDFTMAEEPDQKARRAARAAEKAEAQPPKRKRGRPRKNPVPE